MDIFEIPNQISDYGYSTAGNDQTIEEIGRFELEGHLGSSDFGTTGDTTSIYATGEYRDEIRAEQNQQPTNQARDLWTRPCRNDVEFSRTRTAYVSLNGL